MSRQGEFLYRETDDFQLLALPCFRKTTYLLLPRKGWFNKRSVVKLEQEILGGGMRLIVESMEERSSW